MVLVLVVVMVMMMKLVMMVLLVVVIIMLLVEVLVMMMIVVVVAEVMMIMMMMIMTMMMVVVEKAVFTYLGQSFSNCVKQLPDTFCSLQQFQNYKKSIYYYYYYSLILKYRLNLKFREADIKSSILHRRWTNKREISNSPSTRMETRIYSAPYWL